MVAPSTQATPQESDVSSADGPNEPTTPASKGPKRWIGLAVGNMKEPVQGAPPDARCTVMHTNPGGPGASAGVREGDVIVKSAGAEVKQCKEYLAGARTIPLGGRFPIEVLRQGQRLPFELGVVEEPRDRVQWSRDHFPGAAQAPLDLPLLRPATGRTTVKDGEGKVQILYFWATWCGPCRQTAPMLDAAAKELGPKKLRILAVSSEEAPVIETYLAHSTTSYAVAHDERSDLKRYYEVTKLPTVVLIGKDGRVVRWATSLSGVQQVITEARALAKG